MTRSVESIINVPDNAGNALRRHLGLAEASQLRISFIPGPGDVAGTFAYWKAREHDPRVPIVAYSLMFYELMTRLNATAQILTTHPDVAMNVSTDERFHFVPITRRPFNGRWSFLRRQRAYARDLLENVSDFDPHIVIAATDAPSAAWKELAQHRKLVLSAHNTFWPMGSPPNTLKSQLRLAILSAHAKNLDAAVCTSHECARQIATITKNRVKGEVQCPQIVAHYPVEPRARARKLLFLGRIEASKGIFLLLDVFDKLAPHDTELILVIAGSGSSEADLKSRIAASPSKDRITFLGRVPSDSVHLAISNSDLLICPTMSTFNEGLAVVGFEAAAHGIPALISSTVPAIDLLGESCMVYEVDDRHSFGEALSRLIDNEEVYCASCAATAAVRDKIYDSSLSWGSRLFRALMQV